MPAAEVIAILRANVSDFTAKMDEAEAKFASVSKAGGSGFEKLASVGKVALFGIGAAAIGVGVASIDLADKYQSATNTIAANGDISIAKANEIGKAFLGTAGTTIYSAQNIATSFGAVAGQVKLMNGGVLNAAAAMAPAERSQRFRRRRRAFARIVAAMTSMARARSSSVRTLSSRASPTRTWLARRASGGVEFMILAPLR